MFYYIYQQLFSESHSPAPASIPLLTEFAWILVTMLASFLLIWGWNTLRTARHVLACHRERLQQRGYRSVLLMERRRFIAPIILLMGTGAGSLLLCFRVLPVLAALYRAAQIRPPLISRLAFTVAEPMQRAPFMAAFIYVAACGAVILWLRTGDRDPVGPS